MTLAVLVMCPFGVPIQWLLKYGLLVPDVKFTLSRGDIGPEGGRRLIDEAFNQGAELEWTATMFDEHLNT